MENDSDGIGFADECWDEMWSDIDRPVPPQEQERFRITLSLIPEDCTSILDVGCGNGIITNQLVSRCERVVGLRKYLALWNPCPSPTEVSTQFFVARYWSI